MFWQANEPDINTKHSPQLEPGWFIKWKKTLKFISHLQATMLKRFTPVWRGEITAAASFFLFGLCGAFTFIYMKESEYVFEGECSAFLYPGSREPNSRALVIYLLAKQISAADTKIYCEFMQVNGTSVGAAAARPQLIARARSYVENRAENRDFFGSTDGNSGERVRKKDAPRAKLSFLPPHIAAEKQKARSKESEREWKHAQSARRAAANCCRHAGLLSPNYAEYVKCNLAAEFNLRLTRVHHCEITRKPEKCGAHFCAIHLIWNTSFEFFANFDRKTTRRQICLLIGI